MENINTKMKDWDSENKGYLKFRSFSKNNNSSSISRNEILSSNDKGISPPTPKSCNPPLTPTNVTTSVSTNHESPTECHIEKCVNGTLSDSNILKSVRTYAKKKETISYAFCDKLDSETEKSLKTSKDDNKYPNKNKYLKTYSAKCNSSRSLCDIFENGNSCGDFQNNSFTNSFSGDLEVGLRNDDAKFSLYDSPTEHESSNIIENDLMPTISDEVVINGYRRTRKNLKTHLVEQKKLDEHESSNLIENDLMPKISGKVVINGKERKKLDDSEDDTSLYDFRKATTSMETQISPPAFLPNGASKKPHKRKKKFKIKHNVSSPKDSEILKSPKASMEKTHKNSSSLSVDIISPSNSKKKMSMLDVVQMLSVKRQKQASGASPEVTKKERFKSHLSVSEQHRPPKSITLSRTGGKKRSISCDEGLIIVKRPHLSSTSDATAGDVANRYSLARLEESISRSPTEDSFMNGDPLESHTPSVQNAPAQESLTPAQKAYNPHKCSKTKLLHVPIIVCDCGNSNSTDDTDAFMPSLTAQVNNFASIVVNIAKQNPENFQSLSYHHYQTFCDSVQRVFHQTSVENSCDIFDFHSSVANILSTAEPVNGDSELDGNQCQAFINSAFNFSNKCLYKMINSFVRNLDVIELQFTVKHFCSSPHVVRLMSKFFSDLNNSSLTSVGQAKFLFEFSVNDPLCSVVKNYTKLFVHKVWPVGSKTIASQSLMKFAYKNMSVAEISIMSYFFHRTELLTLKDLVSRLTYVAVLSIYKFHGKIN